MGGFATPSGVPIITRQQLQDPEIIDAIKSTRTQDIIDKSKGEATFKALAVAQIVWFIARCIIRASRHLFLTQLEVSTLAFTSTILVVWALWWHKPRDVQTPIWIGSSERDADVEGFRSQSWLQGLISGTSFLPDSSPISIPSAWSP
ncbi:hypothetical protein DFH09DRAFT_1122535, partial [Mycena vulgaris]